MSFRSNRKKAQAVLSEPDVLDSPFHKGSNGTLDYRLSPGTSGWNRYESFGITPLDAAHISCVASDLACYFGIPEFENLHLFDDSDPKWILPLDVVVAKWEYEAAPHPVKEGQKEEFLRKLQAFRKKHKLFGDVRPGVVHFGDRHLKCDFHGFDALNGTLIHVLDKTSPSADFWLWHVCAMAYRASVLSLAGFKVKRVIFGDLNRWRDINGDRMEGFLKYGALLRELMRVCYDEFVVNGEEIPFI